MTPGDGVSDSLYPQKYNESLTPSPGVIIFGIDFPSFYGYKNVSDI